MFSTALAIAHPSQPPPGVGEIVGVIRSAMARSSWMCCCRIRCFLSPSRYRQSQATFSWYSISGKAITVPKYAISEYFDSCRQVLPDRLNSFLHNREKFQEVRD